jgi:p21-activated kinase 1
VNLSSLEDEAESSLPSTPRSSHATTLIANPGPSPGPSPNPVRAVPFPPSNDGDSFTPSYPAGFIPTNEGPFSRLVDRSIHMSTVSRSRAGTVSAKGKKGMLGFMTDILSSNKRRRPKISTPYDPIQLTHVDFNTSVGKFTGLPKEWQQLLQDSGASKFNREKNPRPVMETVKFYEGGGDVWDKMGHAPAPGSSQSPPIPGTLQAAFPGLSKSVSVFPLSSPPPSDNSKRPALSTPNKAHSSGGPLVVSTSHPRAYRSAPTPPQSAQLKFDLLNPQRLVPRPLPKPPRSDSDTLVCANTTKDRRSPGPPASVKATARESPNSSAGDLAMKSQATVGVNGTVAERRAQPPTAPQQQSAAVASLAKSATPRRHEKRKEEKVDGDEKVGRLQQICMAVDPTRLHRNLVEIRQG